MTTDDTKTAASGRRPSKLDTLNAQLVSAKASLAALQAELQPQIDAEQAKVNALRAEWQKAEKASSQAYAEEQSVLREAEARLFPAEVLRSLLGAVKAKVAEKFPHADYVRLAHEHKSRVIAADSKVVAASATSSAAWKVREKASTAYNRANAFDSPLARLSFKLRDFKDRVEKLEREIARLPVRNETARDRRAAEKQEALVAAETEAARKLLADFDWTAEPPKEN